MWTVVHRTAGSRRLQTLAVIAATLLVAGWHWQNDGLWFQGDAPRHAANGFFFWDLLTAFTVHPIEYAVGYYARYPVITPGAYPPLFYLIEGAAFRIIAPSPHVAKALVLAFLMMIGTYTMFWARHWTSPQAGWAGVCTILLPGFVLYSNAVLLNVPCTALMLAALYHAQQWLDSGAARQRNRFIGFSIAAMLTYFPGVMVLPVAYAWMLSSRKHLAPRVLWMVPLILAIAILAIAVAMPTHFWRNAPSMGRLLTLKPWMYYATALPRSIGAPWLIAGVLGTLVACMTTRHRQTATRLLLAMFVIALVIAVLPAMDDRYALILGPLVVLGTFLGMLACTERLGHVRFLVNGLGLAMVVTFGTRQAMAVTVPDVEGIEKIAAYLSENSAQDAVLFSGQHDGIFGFYVRALDPTFSRRVVFSSKLLYRHMQDTKFFWRETPLVASTNDVVARIQNTCGCRWVAVEAAPEAWLNESERLLRETVIAAPFEKVATFSVSAHRVRQIDLYRLRGPVAVDPPVDLQFPSFSERVFHGVRAIKSR